MTGLDVLDTALKIALGATLSGLFTWLGAKGAHRRDLEKERYRRRQDAIERIAEQFETVCQLYLDCSTDAMLAAFGSGSVEKAIASMNAISTAIDLQRAVDGRLRLFGLHEAAQRLEAFSLKAGVMNTIATITLREQRRFTADEMKEYEKLAKELRRIRESFYEKLSKDSE